MFSYPTVPSWKLTFHMYFVNPLMHLLTRFSWPRTQFNYFVFVHTIKFYICIYRYMDVSNHEYIKIFGSFLCANNCRSKGKNKFFFPPLFLFLKFWIVEKKYQDDYHTRNIQLYAMFCISNDIFRLQRNWSVKTDAIITYFCNNYVFLQHIRFCIYKNVIIALLYHYN